MLSKKIIQQTGKDLKSSFSAIQNIPGLVIAKDIHSKYAAISNDYAKLLGWKNADACTDLSDYDIPCDAVNAADLFVNLDQMAISKGTSVISLYICQYAYGWKTLLSSKTPIQKENGDLTGILGQVIDVSDTGMYQWYLNLNYFDLKFTNEPGKPSIYILNQEQSPLPLSRKQQTCLFFLIRGKSMKEIGAILDISVRTVEKYCEQIKKKLNCNSKSQLIDLAISSGFFHYVPEEIAQNTKIHFNPD